jgi:hypothetical protein
MGGPELEEQEVPEKIKESHKCWWWFVFVLFITTSIGCIVALKIFDALIALMIGIWAYYLVKDNCKNMSQQCLFSFGLMCVLQAVMEFIILAMSLPGRRTQSTTATPGHGASPHGAPSPFMGGPSSSSYTVTVKTSPFFCEEEGWHYNLQSSMMIANCVVFIIAGIVTRCSYMEYPNSLFDQPESRPIGSSPYGAGGGSIYSGGGGRQYGGNTPARPAGGNSWGGGQRLGGSGGSTFGGSGQRLGSA